MHKVAHNFQLPHDSCLANDLGAAQALGRFLAAAAVALGLEIKVANVVVSNTPARGSAPAIHRFAVVFESEREGVAAPVIELATRAVALSTTMPAARFIERMEANASAAKSTARTTFTAATFDLAPDRAGVDLASGPDATALTTYELGADGPRRAIEEPTIPGADPTYADENESDL